MLNKIKQLLGLEYEIDSKPFRQALRGYPTYMMVIGEECSSSYLRNITKVTSTKRNNVVTVHITTHSPGILIGKAGSLINSIKDYMQLKSGEIVKIDIKEEQMFNNLF